MAPVVYTFVDAARTYVQRGSDQAIFPWDSALQQPLDLGYTYRIWFDDGSPPPQPYVAVVVSAGHPQPPKTR